MKKDKIMISYEMRIVIAGRKPLIRGLNFSNPKEFKGEWLRLGKEKRVYDAFVRNEGVVLLPINKLDSLPVALKLKVTRVLKIFIFTEEQLLTNKRIFANGKSNGLTSRTIQIYQLVYAGVDKKNICDYLPITEKTVHSNCSASRKKLGLDFNSEVKKLLIS